MSNVLLSNQIWYFTDHVVGRKSRLTNLFIWTIIIVLLRPCESIYTHKWLNSAFDIFSHVNVCAAVVILFEINLQYQSKDPSRNPFDGFVRMCCKSFHCHIISKLIITQQKNQVMKVSIWWLTRYEWQHDLGSEQEFSFLLPTTS